MKNKVCFSMYLAIKEIINRYNEFLKPLDLTYTQYLVMSVLWEYDEVEMKSLCEKVCLDSNTLSPVINRLIKKNYVSKSKSKKDKRVIIIKILEGGLALKEKAKEVHDKIYNMVNLNEIEKENLVGTLEKIRTQLEK